MRSERGVSESVQWTLILPALLLCVLGLIQAGIIIYAHLVTQEAANATAVAQALYHASPGEGEAAARKIAATGRLSDVKVSVTTRGTTVQARVSGRAPVLFNLGPTEVTAEATAPKERITR